MLEKNVNMWCTPNSEKNVNTEVSEFGDKSGKKHGWTNKWTNRYCWERISLWEMSFHWRNGKRTEDT